MKKIVLLVILGLFTISVLAQETPPIQTDSEKTVTAKKTQEAAEKSEKKETKPTPKEANPAEENIPAVEEQTKKDNQQLTEKETPDFSALSKQIDELKQESAKREQDLLKNRSEMDALKEELQRMKEEQNKEKVAEKIEKKSAEENKSEKPVIFNPYGSIELYGYANDASFYSNDFMLYVLNENKSTVNISARNTMFGLDISMPCIKAFDLSGKLEIDFFGSFPDSGNADINAGIRMRHAFFKLSKTFKSKTTLGLTAGQTWTTATIPFFPNVINPALGWGAGNPWNRLPLAELFLTQSAGKIDMGLKIGAAKPITGASANRKMFLEMNIDAGDASHWPSLQSQIFVKSNFQSFNFLWAAGGAYGRENYTGGIKVNGSDTLTYGDEVNVWLFNTGLQLIHNYAELQGKFFIGENLDMFGVFGGSIIKDKDGYVSSSMRAMGYWAELSMKPFKEMKLSTGFGSEYIDPNDADDYNSRNYNKNSTFWVSVFYTFYDHFTVGFEWQNTNTYKQQETENSSTEIKISGNSFVGDLKFSF